MATFNFCPERNVPETLPREGNNSAVTMNSWQFNAKPTTPYVRKFKVTLHGLVWYLNQATGLYDSTTNPNFNARALEIFYEQHETWRPFVFNHQHFGPLNCRFSAPLTVPAGLKDSGGRLGPIEMTLIQHNPGYS